MCCLKYEEDNYEQTRKNMPKIGKDVETPDGYGMVIDLNVLKETVTVRVRKGDSSELKTYPVTDIRWFRPPVVPATKPTPESESNISRPVKKAVPYMDHNLEVITSDDAFDVAEPEEELPLENETMGDDTVFETEPLTEEIYEDQASSNWQQAVAEALRKAQDSSR